MYALVMWIGDEPTTSVIPSAELEVVDKKTRAKWGPKYWPVQLLRQSEDKAWLESLSVITNGDVLWSRSAEENINIAKKRKMAVDRMKNGDCDNQSRKSPRPWDLAEEKSTVNDHDDSNKGDNSNTDSDCSTEKKIDTKDESSQTKHQPNLFADLPKVTAEIVEFMNCLVQLLESQLSVETKFHTPIRKAAVTTPQQRTELLPGTGIWISVGDLTDITNKCPKKPKEMVRRLMRVLVKKEELTNMTPKGKGLHKPIPNHIFSAVETYVNRNVHQGFELSRTEYTRCLALMCNTLRRNSERTARFIKAVDDDGDSSVDDRRRTRAARKNEAVKSSKSKSNSSKGKNKRAQKQNK